MDPFSISLLFYYYYSFIIVSELFFVAHANFKHTALRAHRTAYAVHFSSGDFGKLNLVGALLYSSDTWCTLMGRTGNPNLTAKQGFH